MCDPEVFSAIGEWIALTHAFGEETWSSMQWWISGSFAIILTCHFARDSLNAFVASLLGLLYVLFSVVVGFALQGNSEGIGLAVQDLNDFASAHSCGELRALRPHESTGWGAQAILVFVVLMGSSTLGYLAYSCWLNSKVKDR